jgi:CheY-like chemotaxis protein
LEEGHESGFDRMGRMDPFGHDHDPLEVSRMSGATVFVVDDDDEILGALGEVMEMEGLRPRLFATAEDALEALAFANERPALFVVDLLMPRLSGSALMEILRDSPAWEEIPIVVFTASVDVRVPTRLGLPIIEKPNIEALVAAVATLRGARGWGDQPPSVELATFRPIDEPVAFSAHGPE